MRYVITTEGNKYYPEDPFRARGEITLPEVVTDLVIHAIHKSVRVRILRYITEKVVYN
jgi:hypothetical protein